MLSRTFLLVLVAGSGLLTACGSSEEFTVDDTCACGFYTSQAGSKIMTWPEGSQIRFDFDAQFTQNLRPAVKSAALAYNNVLAKTSIQLDVNSSNAPTYRGNPDQLSRDGVNGIYLVDEPWPFPDGQEAEGMTVVQFDPAGIVEADIYIRLAGLVHPNSTVAPFYSILPIDRAAILLSDVNVRWARVLNLHEMGHALGLVHSEKENAVMNPYVWLELSDTGLGTADISTLSKGYELRNTRFLQP